MKMSLGRKLGWLGLFLGLLSLTMLAVVVVAREGLI